MKKTCTKCGFTKNKKNWKRQGKQKLMCKTCGHIWEHGKRKIEKNEEIKELFQ